MIVIAHLSDTHIDDGHRSSERTRAVMDYLESLPYDLDAVLVTGDIADHALPAEYEQARSLLTSRHPVVICPGNHDERAAFRQFLLGQPPSAAPVNQVHRTADFVIALCDSSVPGKDEGFLEDETLAWLEDVLAQAPAEVPVLVGFHHPPTLLHVPFIDGVRQFGAERLAALTGRHPNLAAFLCGHAHTSAATTFAGRPLLVAPGVVSTLRLPWEQHTHPEDYVHLDQPPALAFHVWDDEGRLTTHYRCVIN
ncbi:metallophosphoesterase [Streptomyces sp. NPDC050844]|uniref:metallophosphoesterase n=1 Tax=Streptomyces sp. NPDC050844 TaxID=3155790 RepID=UPI0033C4C5DA